MRIFLLLLHFTTYKVSKYDSGKVSKTTFSGFKSNPIETVWNDLKACLRDFAKPSNIAQLANSICDFWKSTVTLDYCNKTIDHLYTVRKMVISLKREVTGK